MIDFVHEAKNLIGQKVRVITENGNYTGKLLAVGDDALVLQVRTNGRLRRLIIRIAEIIILFSLLGV
ncbi:hypothetical protein JOD45_000620 [Scopulibacillus daqui]|uniref:DUF2642 domain-containing protein n=1 Tax=Scopulibacillus daqui TaxID=1469162 RepID=A0ABS2PWL1_9BACL|nr:DUF2642 domain-containing protein [Scopulibacillus daqui]MBM7644427.1 hypothetical protein [Scopulibacillus daqui]